MNYRILQIKYIEDTKYAFRSYEYALKHGFTLSDYVEVYRGINSEKGSDNYILESLFVQFNLNRPDDFTGHSLSVSDIVVLEDKYYYCDSASWEEITFEGDTLK